MKRADIVNWIAKNSDVKLDKKDIANIVDETFEIMSNYLSNDLYEGKKVMISGFGSFIVKKRKPKVGRNPKTKEEKLIPERFGISFKVGKILKKKINGK
ncbi:MAG: HU family DNA-binding protein [Hydrogenothermaceae bacterium]|nr:HU family DNA-binding protein [Hydrogenothermaceae bacterium]